jgi:uncharacterized protein
MGQPSPKDNCFIIPVNNSFLLYSPLINVMALINGSAVRELKDQMSLIQKNKGDKQSRFFGLAKDIHNGKTVFPMRKTGDVTPDFLGIIPTRSCNGACNYCDFGADKAPFEKMSYQLAAKAVDWYSGLIKSKQRDILEVHFFGGEPMMARDVIEVIVQRGRLLASEQNIIPYFEISTNGQYDFADAEFLGQYFNKVVLSLDGLKEVQDRHRPVKSGKSSFENAIETAKIISGSDAELCIRCCVSQINVLNMEEFTEWLCRDLRITAINFEILCETTFTTTANLFPPDPVEFAIHFQKSREIGNHYGVEVVYASNISGTPVVSSCPVGKDTAIVSPDGRLSNCYLLPERWINAGLDLDFGKININEDVLIEINKIEAIRKMVEDKPRCNNCFCQWSCAGGCHVGITNPGSSPEYDNFCIQTRLISAFTLLSDLGLNDKIEELIRSPESIKKLVSQVSDKIIF